MSLRTYFLLAAVAVCISTLHAFPMDGFDTSNKCQCLRTRTSPLPSRMIQRVEIVPASAQCRKIEILVTKKDNQIICIEPEAKWIQKLIVKIMSSRAAKETVVPTAA